MPRKRKYITFDPQAYDKAYYKNNRTRLLKKQNLYAASNREQEAKRANKYYLEHKEKSLQKSSSIYHKNKYNWSLERKYTHMERSTAKRNLKCTITLDDYKNFGTICHYCHKDFSKNIGHGLDRKDCSLGYIANNVVPCCGECNSIKGNKLTYEEAVYVISKLNNFRKRRNKKC